MTARARGLARYFAELHAIGAMRAVAVARTGGLRCRLADLLDKAADGGRLRSRKACGSIEKRRCTSSGAAAHARRMALYPSNDVTYVIDTTINYTNVCNVHCTFLRLFPARRARRRATR